jgi:hypothetical protein
VNPDVAVALERLERRGVLTPESCVTFHRVARGELVSVRAELRLLLYGAVITVMAGVSLLVRANLDRIGPVAIASALSLAALVALGWALRRAPAFAWGKAPSSHLAVDYILLLGVLLTGAALAYVEVQFTPLGAAWSYHLLVVSVLAATLAVRGDSAMVAGMALATFAAWRGVAASSLDRALWRGDAGADWLRVNAILTGILFVAIGYLCVRLQRKAHFEPVATHLGWLLILGGVLAGIGVSGGSGWLFSLGLFVVGTGLAGAAFHYGRFPLFGMGLAAAYVGLSALVLRGLSNDFLIFAWFAATGVAVLAFLLVVHKIMRRRE